MPTRYIHPHRVAFVETDMAGIVHFSNYFRFMEQAEHAFLRSLGHDVHNREYGFPRVHASCDYLAPARFGDELDIVVRVKEKRTRAVTYAISVHPRDGHDTVLARGLITAVCVSWDEQTGAMKAVPLPAGLADQLEVDPEAAAPRDT